MYEQSVYTLGNYHNGSSKRSNRNNKNTRNHEHLINKQQHAIINHDILACVYIYTIHEMFCFV